jgi:peptidoglycan/LPS O-acetylase OafA/YrhL
VAILSVFLYHSLGTAIGYYNQPWKGTFPDFSAAGTYWPLFPLTLGSCGVAIFFVVSGFCIHLSHYRSKGESWRAFAVKRFFRLYPPYLLALSVFYLSWPWRTYSLSSPGWRHQFWTHFFLIHNIEPGTAFGINGSLWSIAIEVQLYLIYPLLLLMVAIVGWRYSLGILFLLELSIRMSIIPGISAFDSLHLSPLGYWFSWSLGAYLAHLYLNKSFLRFNVWYLYFSIMMASLAYLVHPLEKFQFMAVALLTSVVIWREIYYLYSKPSKFSWTPFLRHLTALGTVSYSFYLIHQPFLLLVQRLNSGFKSISFDPIFLLFLCFVMYFLLFNLSKILYSWVELPFAAIGKRLAA